jgi:uncharacterized membrane protein YbhN (UPF0104 family)
MLRRRLAGRKKLIVTLTASVALAAAAFLLIGKVASYARLAHELGKADWPWLSLCVLGEILAYTGYILGYRDVARVDGGPKLSYRTVIGVVATGFGAFVVTSAGGPAVDYWALTRAGATRNDAVTRVLALNTMKFFVLALGTALAAVALAAGAGNAPLALLVPWLVVPFVCIALALWLSGPGLGSRLAPRPTDHDHSLCGFRFGEHCVRYLVREGLHDAVRGLVYVRDLAFAPVRYAGASVGWPLYWAGDVLCLWAGLRAFGTHVGVAALVVAYATGYLASALPLPAGGTGGIEAAMTYALHAVGVPLAPALLGVGAYRVFNFWLPILPATAVLPVLRRIEAQLVAVGEAAPAPV